MNRINEMIQYSDEVIGDRILEQVKELEKSYIENDKSKELTSEFNKTLDELFKKYMGQQKKLGKNKAGFLIISPLLSSITSGNYEFQFALYSKELYLDETECVKYWCPKQLFEFVDQDMKYLETQLNKKFIRITKYELDIIRQKITLSYNALTMLYFMEKIPWIQKMDSFMNMEKESMFRVLYGEYMNKTITIYTYTREEP